MEKRLLCLKLVNSNVEPKEEILVHLYTDLSLDEIEKYYNDLKEEWYNDNETKQTLIEFLSEEFFARYNVLFGRINITPDRELEL